jgi:2-oxoglutarate/2-oxoacid ferredoxin oxidoreductase subunit beta
MTKITRKNIQSPIKPTWCPGCGNFGITRALHKGLEEMELGREEVMLTFGVGCCDNGADFNLTYGIHSLHGRSVPPAIGAKLANHDLKVISVSGDGGQYGEGLNHLMFAARGNHDITMLVHNNNRYSLTTGQASPTTERGTVTKTTPEGLIEHPFNPLSTALTAHATFVARAYSNDYKQLKEIIKAAVQHRGYALVDILQPCVTFNKQYDFKWYKEHVEHIPEDYDHSDWNAAMQLATKPAGKLFTGIYYQDEETKAYHEQIEELQEGSLISQWQSKIDISPVSHHYA